MRENPKYAKYKHIDCSEIYNTYGKLFGDTGDAAKLPINTEGTNSSGSPNLNRGNSSMNISRRQSGEKQKGKQQKNRGSKKQYSARDVSASFEHMVSVGTDLASIARSHRNEEMSVVECVDELLSSGYVKEGDVLYLFALWFFRDKDNQNSYCAAKTPFLRFKFVKYCFERDNMSRERKT
ncbi:Hypothetical predicted protein [Olea europaea subsp. europaea]|uniref:Uncharacterized protein n=1 Tax=Olea europaea subsp. europaea TaxID=158383 RepID=A0A8S0V0K1_OLEEU|nr:Hypothetical predicted protein [Olea europaea subsp. europaea]